MQGAKHDIHIILDDETLKILNSKVKDADMNKSDFIRELIVNGKVLPFTNGKTIVEKLGLIHNKANLYHRDMAERIDDLKEVVREHSDLLRRKREVIAFHDSGAIETPCSQSEKIDAAIKLIKDAYEYHERETEELIHRTVESIG